MLDKTRAGVNGNWVQGECGAGSLSLFLLLAWALGRGLLFRVLLGGTGVLCGLLGFLRVDVVAGVHNVVVPGIVITNFAVVVFILV